MPFRVGWGIAYASGVRRRQPALSQETTISLFSSHEQDLIEAVNQELPRNLVCSRVGVKMTSDHAAAVEMVLINVKPVGKMPESFSQRERVRRCVAEALLAVGGSDFHSILYEDKQEDKSVMRSVHRALM